MTPTAAATLSFEEFERLPNPPEGRYELVRGELVHVPPPKKGHKRIQMLLERWILRRLPTEWECTSEFGVQIGPDSYLIPDVAVVRRSRWESTPDTSYFEGGPELAVEVISPGNTASEIDEKVTLYFEQGTLECWIVDPSRRRITVTSVDQPRRSYSTGESVPLTRFGIAEPLPLNTVFAD